MFSAQDAAETLGCFVDNVVDIGASAAVLFEFEGSGKAGNASADDEDAVTEIEDVAGASGGAAEDVFRARLQFLPPGKQQHGIEVTLDSALVIEPRPAFVEREAPVESDDVGSGFFHSGKQRSAVGAE